jgi:hypothetical protein
VSPAERLAAVVAIQGPEWYYEVLGLRPALSQLGVGQRIDDYLLDGPVFSPDERYVVTVGSPRFVWWARPEEGVDEEWQLPSEGGRYELGWVYVQDSQRGTRRSTRWPYSPRRLAAGATRGGAGRVELDGPLGAGVHRRSEPPALAARR